MSDNSTKAAHAVLGFLCDEGLIDREDPIMEMDKAEAYLADIIAGAYGEVIGIQPVTIDEIEEKDFHDFNERLRFDW